MMEGFVLLPVLSGSSFMSVTSNGINFNGNVVRNMQMAKYVNLFLNLDTKQVAIKKCDIKDEESVKFYRNESNLKNGVRINNRELQQKFSRIMNWDLETYNYRIVGFFSDEDNAVIFDLNNARKFRKRNSQKTNT